MAKNSWNGREQNHLFLNQGDGRFIESGGALGLAGIADARGMALSDFDLDGDQDIVVNNYRAQASYFENRMADGKGWVALRLQGTESNRDGVGAQISVKIGSEKRMRLVGNHSYSGQSSLEQIFGIGKATAVDEIEVRWPNGVLEKFGSLPSGTRSVLIEGKGNKVDAPKTEVKPAAARAMGWPFAFFGLLLILSYGFLKRRSA